MAALPDFSAVSRAFCLFTPALAGAATERPRGVPRLRGFRSPDRQAALHNLVAIPWIPRAAGGGAGGARAIHPYPGRPIPHATHTIGGDRERLLPALQGYLTERVSVP